MAVSFAADIIHHKSSSFLHNDQVEIKGNFSEWSSNNAQSYVILLKGEYLALKKYTQYIQRGTCLYFLQTRGGGCAPVAPRAPAALTLQSFHSRIQNNVYISKQPKQAVSCCFRLKANLI